MGNSTYLANNKKICKGNLEITSSDCTCKSKASMPNCLFAHGLLFSSGYVHKFISHNPASVLKRENLCDYNIMDNPTSCRQTEESSVRLQIYHLHLKNSPGSWSYTESLPAWIPGLDRLSGLCTVIKSERAKI